VLGRTLHPVQVARAAVLAKASSAGGAVLLGCYAGLLAWTLPAGLPVAVMEQDALVAGLSALASAGLVLAALALERACRTPGQDDDRDGAPASRRPPRPGRAPRVGPVSSSPIDLHSLTTEELRQRAFDKAERSKDVGLLLGPRQAHARRLGDRVGGRAPPAASPAASPSSSTWSAS
jgi:hypothetical protein